jgi:DNA-binding transcriptional MerR regulator
MQYRIGEFAELSGVSTKTLRYYEKIGLLRPAAVDARTRYRSYATAQLRDLSSILALRELGLPLLEIRAFLARTGSQADRRPLLLRLRQNTQHMIERARQSLNNIDAVLGQELDHPGFWTRTVPVVIKRRPGIRVASLRAQIKDGHYSDVSRFERELLGALPGELLGSVRGTLWHRCADGSLNAEAFIEIRHDPPRRSFYDLKDLPPVTAACAFCSNDDAAADEAYCAIRTWMASRGLILASPKREIYLDDMLEIQFPLESA